MYYFIVAKSEYQIMPYANAQSYIAIVAKRAKQKQALLQSQGYLLIDVTSKADDITFRKFSPFFPHGGLPIPGMKDRMSESVEGIWQGLKVFEREGIDPRKFLVKNMVNIKRPCGEKRGSVLGHQYGDKLLDYTSSRQLIYIPAYIGMLQTHLEKELTLLQGLLAEGQKIAFIDYDTNSDIYNTNKPLSHASIIISYLTNNN